MELGRFAVTVIANTWLMSTALRQWIKTELLEKERRVIFQGKPGYRHSERLNESFTRELTEGSKEIRGAAEWPEARGAAGAHMCGNGDRPVPVGGGLSLIHAKEGGAARVHLRNGSTLEVELPAKSSLIFDTKTGAHLL